MYNIHTWRKEQQCGIIIQIKENKQQKYSLYHLNLVVGCVLLLCAVPYFLREFAIICLYIESFFIVYQMNLFVVAKCTYVCIYFCPLFLIQLNNNKMYTKTLRWTSN